jgi:hypothetical protein
VEFSNINKYSKTHRVGISQAYLYTVRTVKLIRQSLWVSLNLPGPTPKIVTSTYIEQPRSSWSGLFYDLLKEDLIRGRACYRLKVYSSASTTNGIETSKFTPSMEIGFSPLLYNSRVVRSLGLRAFHLSPWHFDCHSAVADKSECCQCCQCCQC